MNPHFVSGRRRRRHYTACPTRPFIRAQTALEELFARARSLRGLTTLSASLLVLKAAESTAGH